MRHLVAPLAGRKVNYARRQQYRRLLLASESAVGAAGAALLAFEAATIGAGFVSVGLLLTAVALGVYARHLFALADRSGVGACSEDAVQHALAPLQAEGWRLRHSLPWRGRGDIDSVAIAPTGIAIAIETKTSRYDRGHLVRVRQQAVWLSHRRRRWARNGALPVLCVVMARGLEHAEGGVLVVSIDRLLWVLRVAAGTSQAPNE